ncbi:hypothetical protein [Rhodocyclus gracilis]|uniref:MarR family transcriptional regulator n=1 Tax=Rhodocyclus tenuis TaxID=1066 RepID=A0A6L5JXP2_RHOTE|nr:hypothetical protein [Rhodocyclus gracilis]MQY52127.1 hypothetical protein [Rhodocyclus gracilis]
MSNDSPNSDCHTLDAYFRLLSISQILRQQSALAELDAVDQRLLEFVGVAEHLETRLSVTTAMALRAAGSSATVYRRLQRLREKGWIDVTPSPDDTRAKVISLTAHTLSQFALLATALNELAATDPAFHLPASLTPTPAEPRAE